MEAEDLQELLNYAYFYLKFRPRTKKEVKDYLLKKIKTRHWSTSEVDLALKRLEDQSFINDEAFVTWFVEQRNKSKPKSEFAIRRELRRFGIEQEKIDKYFEKNLLDEESLAHKALVPRWKRLKSFDKRKRFEKAARFLLSRGFSYDILRKTIERLENR
jgi:regulatory protein